MVNYDCHFSAHVEDKRPIISVRWGNQRSGRYVGDAGMTEPIEDRDE